MGMMMIPEIVLVKNNYYYIICVLNHQYQKFTFSASTCYLVFKVVAKLTYLVAIIGDHVTAQLLPIVRFTTKQNSIWSKALIMPLMCFVL